MSPTKTLPLPPVLEAKLAAFRQRVWVVKLAEGLLAAAFGLALSYTLVFALDRFMDTPGWLRGCLLTAGALTLGLGLPLKWHRWVWQQRQLEDAARLLRRTFPRLGDQLLGIVELSRLDAASGGSETLVRAAMNQAAEAVKDSNFDDAVPEDQHRRWAWAAGSAVALIVVAFLVVSGAAWNAVERWVTPWRAVDRYTFAKVEALPERLVVPFAEPFDLNAKLRADTEWSPQSGKVRVTDQPAVVAAKQEGQYGFNLPPQKAGAEMKVSIGDVRKSIAVVPTQRPELKGLQAQLQLPAYLEYKTQPVIEARGGSVALVKGAQAAFVLTASRALASAEMDGQAQKISADRVETKPTLIEKDTEHTFTWKDQDGLAAREPLRLKVAAVDDESPHVLARRETQEQVILDTETIAIDLEVSDDFGIKRTGLEWRGLPGEVATEPAKGERVAAAGAPEKKDLAARATFCAVTEGIAPQSLELRAWAEDYKPGRPERAKSPAFVVHILGKDDHAIWMTEQFGKWLQAARETYEHEQRLHEANRELRQLTSGELDRPENRRKIAQQSQAENANGERLNALNDNGKKLIEQAARNDAFDAKRLETWATMLKTLKDISEKRMPSVADLLKQSSNAAAGKSQQASANSQQSKPGEQKPSSPSDSTAQAKPSDSSAKPAGNSEQKPSDMAQAKPSDGKSSPSSPSQSQQAKAGESKPAESKPSAPQVAQGEQKPGSGAPKPTDPNAKPKPPAPSVSDKEMSYFKQDPNQPKPDPNAKPKPPGAGKLGLPSTQLGAAPSKPGDDKKPEDQQQAADTPAQENLDKAIAEQKKLLDAFATVSDQLRELLASLEASTFVKRLKAASKKQMAVASALNTTTLSAFGLDKKKVAEQQAKQSGEIAKRETDESGTIRVIQSDLEAYYQRKQDMRFKNILEQMKKTEVVAAIARIGEEVTTNWSGRSIAASEFWADTLDRWAEEMVSASQCSSCSSCSGDSLPPEIVLKVMQALHDEMKLRDVTREAEAAKPALDKTEFTKRARDLALRQDDIGKRTYMTAVEISKLPNAKSFEKEMKLLTAVTQVMGDAYKHLDKPDTGAPAVAAETEAIELLLQAKRQNPKGGGGGGGSPGASSASAASASMAALTDIGPGADSNATIIHRQTGQSTGKAGKQFPEEFKTGLDAYFNALEKDGGGQ